MNEAGDDAPAGEVVGVVATWAVCAVLGGAAVEWGLPTASGAIGLLLLGVGGMSAVALGVLAARRTGDPQLGAGWGIAVAVVVVLVMGAGVLLRMDASDRGMLVGLVDRGGSATMSAVVVAEPRQTALGWDVLLQVDRVAGEATRERAVTTRDEPPALGQAVRLEATARPLPDGGYGRWLARRHAVAVLDTLAWTRTDPPSGVAALSESLRERVRRSATRYLDHPEGGLLVGFVTGDTRLLPREDREALQRTGLTHLTAVSGSNVAIVATGVLAVCSLARAPAWVRRWALGLMLPWFALVTRFEPSVMRASVMAAVMLLAASTGRLREPRHALAVGGLLLVAVDPRLSASLGLLLSAMATVGVLVLAPIVQRRVPARVPPRAAELLAITIGAQIAVMPALLAAFGELSLVSIPANLVAVPAAAIAAGIAFVGTAVAVLSVDLAGLVFAAAAPGSAVVLATAHALDDVGGQVALERPVGVVALVAATAWLLVRGPGARAVCAGVTVVAVVAACLPIAGGMVLPRGFSVTAIDVGQGDAFLVETPAVRVLVDAGPDESASRWLRRNGVRGIDLLVVTHPHLDHVGGAADVVRRLDVSAVWATPLPTQLGAVDDLYRVASDRGTEVFAPVAGAVVRFGDVVIEVLHPPPGRPYRHEDSELNESSTVLRLHHDGRRVLFAGDIEAAGQRELLSVMPGRLAAELFAVPHHGSSTTGEAFLAAVGARVGLLSVGADNTHGHPHPSVVSRLEDLDVEVVRTDVSGSVRVPVPHPVP